MTELPTRMSERFTLAELIGRGTCSSVFRARDELLDRDVAVKIFPVTDDPRVAREVSLMASLDHPALVPVYDVGEVDGRAFVVMALFDGGSLTDRLAVGPLALTEALLTGSAVADALAHVHRVGVLHRDVIPRNVLFDADGRAHLSDFGVALVADAPRITDTGIVVGSAPYLAPEQVRGEAVGPTADVYALGLVTLEALTGTRAYPGAPLEAAQARLEQRPAIPAELPTDVVALLDAMTADDPASRPDAEAVCRRMRQAALASEIVDGDPRGALVADPAVTDLTVVAPAPRGAGLRHARRGTLVLGAATAAIMMASGVVIAATGPVGGIAATTPPGAALSAPALEAPAVPAPLLGGSGVTDSDDSADASQAADTPETSGADGPTREQQASVVADSSPDSPSDSSPGTAALRRAQPDVRTTEADAPARPAEPSTPRSTDDVESPRSAPDDTTTSSPSSSTTGSSSSPTTSSSRGEDRGRDRDRDRDRDRGSDRRDDASTEKSTEQSTDTGSTEKSTGDRRDRRDRGDTDGAKNADDAGDTDGKSTRRTGLLEALAQPVTGLLAH